MEGVPIRSARRGDIPSLMMLWEALMRENREADPRLALHPRAKEYMAAQFASWLQDRERFLVVAEEGGRMVVGYAAAAIKDASEWHVPTRIAEITDCFVAPPRRRRGIARRLIGRLLDTLNEKDIDAVQLQTSAKNPEAESFWESMGWEVMEVVFEKPA